MAGFTGYGDRLCIEFEGRWHTGDELTGYVTAVDTALRDAGVDAHAPIDLVVRNRLPQATAVSPEDLASLAVPHQRIRSAGSGDPRRVRAALRHPDPLAYGATEFAGSVCAWAPEMVEEFGAAKRDSVGRPRPDT